MGGSTSGESPPAASSGPPGAGDGRRSTRRTEERAAESDARSSTRRSAEAGAARTEERGASWARGVPCPAGEANTAPGPSSASDSTGGV